jgi:Family of unknown function (DUF5755)
MKKIVKMVAILFIIVGLGLIGYSIYRGNNFHKKSVNSNEYLLTSVPSYPYNNLPTDVLLDAYAPPLKDDRYFVPQLTRMPSRSIVPINVSTNVGAVDTEYRQLGIITPLNGSSKDNILPLMGRPLFTNRNKYQYYTISNQHNNVKLPISIKGKSGLDEYGVDEVYNGDTCYVEGYNDAFKVTIYNNNVMKYLPFV